MMSKPYTAPKRHMAAGNRSRRTSRCLLCCWQVLCTDAGTEMQDANAQCCPGVSRLDTLALAVDWDCLVVSSLGGSCS